MSKLTHLALAALLALTAPAQAAGLTPAQRFERAQADEPSLLAYLGAFPKGGDLHNHLNGALYSEDLVDAALEHGLYFNPQTLKFHHGAAPGLITAAKMAEDDRLLAAFARAASITGATPAGGHDQFFAAFAYIGSVTHAMPVEERIDLVADEARRERIRYVELMANLDGADLDKLQPAPNALADMPAALKALRPAVEAYARAAKVKAEQVDLAVGRHLGYKGRASDAASPVTLRYLASLDRNAPDDDFFAQTAAAMALAKAVPQVVGVNIVAPEDAPVARTHFEAQMRMIAFLWERLGRPHLSMHAGELTPRISPLAPLQTHIRRSIEVGHAERIGHGVAVAWDPNAEGLLGLMRKRHVAVEICLSSNDAILNVAGPSHPVNLYRRAGVPITLATDDEGISRSNLTMEYLKFVRTAHPSLQELEDVSRNGLECSFLPGQSLYLDHDPRRLKAGFEGVRSRFWVPSPAARKAMAASPKLAKEVGLERDLVTFERI